jgi:hypothetical protein
MFTQQIGILAKQCRHSLSSWLQSAAEVSTNDCAVNLVPWAECTCRDLTIVPFYGNSIATRVPAITLTGSSNGTSSSSSSMCWPPFFCGGSSERKAAAVADILVLGDFRAAQRVCLKLKLTHAAPNQQQQCSREQLEDSIRQQMSGGSGDGVSAQQQQQQQQQAKQQGDVMDVWLVNTHLDHASPEIRARQMQVWG